MLETTILVSFNSASSSADHSILVELDDVLNVDSNGDAITSFGQGDSPYIRFNSSNNVTLDAVVATAGGVIDLGVESRSVTADQLFASRVLGEEDKYTLTVLPTSYSVVYTGRTGALFATNEIGGRVTLIGDVGYTPFLATIIAHYSARIFQLVPPDMNLGDNDSTYQIYVVFYVTVEDK
jgi:hypothetical protein